jgi:hypothetical protein
LVNALNSDPERNGHWLSKPQLNIDETRRLEGTLKFCRERAYEQRYPDDNVAASVEMVANKVEDGSVDMTGNKVVDGPGEMVGKEEDEEEDAYPPEDTDDEPDYQPPAQKRPHIDEGA